MPAIVTRPYMTQHQQTHWSPCHSLHQKVVDGTRAGSDVCLVSDEDLTGLHISAVPGDISKAVVIIHRIHDQLGVRW